jgi:hypothetical protein
MNETETKITIKDLIILILIVFAICIFLYFTLTNNSPLDVIGSIIGIPIGLLLSYFMIPFMF